MNDISKRLMSHVLLDVVFIMNGSRGKTLPRGSRPWVSLMDSVVQEPKLRYESVLVSFRDTKIENYKLYIYPVLLSVYKKALFYFRGAKPISPTSLSIRNMGLH